MAWSRFEVALRQIKKTHGEILRLLDLPEVQEQLEPDQREELLRAERILLTLRSDSSEALAHHLAANRQITN